MEYMLLNTENGECDIFDHKTQAENYISKYLEQEVLDTGLNKYIVIPCELWNVKADVEVVLWANAEGGLPFSTEIVAEDLDNSDIADIDENAEPLRYAYIEEYEVMD